MVDDNSNGRYIEILLVEDDANDARRLEWLLKATDDPYRLHTTTSIESALKKLNTLAAQVILLDLSLPDSNGIETIRTLHLAYPWTPIVVLTGLDDEQVVIDAARAGAHDYLHKNDLTSANLLRVLRYALERRFNEEQVRASQALYRRQARELNLLNRIISAASASHEKQTILHDTCTELAQFYETARTLILLRDDNDDSMVTVEAEHHHPELNALLKRKIDLASFVALTAVFLTKQTLILPALPQQLSQLLGIPKENKALIRPLLLEGEIIGAFLLCLPQTHAFATNDERLITTVAEEVGLALEKIQLNGRLQTYANELEERVQKRTHALAEANEQLQSLDKLKSKFVSDVSHELRHPITNLTLYLELLEFAPPQKQTHYFNMLRSQVRRLSSLVEEILTLSRLENNAYHHLYQPVDLNALVEQAVVAHTPRAQSKQINLKFMPKMALPPILGEPNQLTQVVTNLLDNALNYTNHGFIRLSTDLQTSNNTSEVVLSIADSGRGIPEEDLPHIFERFYRGSQVDRDAIIGTGLGLGIVSEIVALHNGRIEVSKTSSQGSHFTVTLPIAPDE